MILVNITYSVVSEESAVMGECEEQGFLDENLELSFWELVRLMETYIIPSQSPNNGNIGVWYETEEETDYISGNTETRSLHYSKSNPKRKEKYWRLAAKCAGLIKG